MVYKILKNGRVKIGLQNTIGAIHVAETANMQNLIVAASVLTGPRARFSKRATVSGQVKGFLALLHRVRG